MPESTPSRWLKLSAVMLAIQAVFAAVAPFFSHVTQRYNPTGGGIMPMGATIVLIVLCVINAIRIRRDRPPLTSPAETLGCYLVLGFLNTAKRPACRQIHEKHDGELPLFDEALHIRVTHAGGYIPINGTNLIAGSVFANFIKLHPPTFEDTLVFSGKDVVNRFAGIDFDVTNFLCQFFGNQGTSTVSNICFTISSDVFSSASAS